MTPEKIISIIAEQFAVPESSLSLETLFKDDLNADSIDLVELTMTLEAEFGLPEPDEDGEMSEIETIGDLIEYINSILG